MPDIQSTQMDAAAVDLLASGTVTADPQVTHTFPLSDSGTAFSAADDRGTSLAATVVVP